MVHEYMIKRSDLTRAAQDPMVSITSDLLDELQRELLAELISEGNSKRCIDAVNCTDPPCLPQLWTLL